MLKVRRFGPVTQYLMGVEHAGQVYYWCACHQFGDALIDSGAPLCAAELLAAVEDAGLARVAVTHHHEDHIGANALLRRRLGLEVLASAAALQPLAQGFALRPYQEMVWGWPEPHAAQALGPELATSHGPLEVLATPGHCPDHVVFLHHESGLAFVGDAFFSTTPKTARIDEDFAQGLESLRLLRDRRPKTMFLGLGQVVENATEALGQCIDHVERLAGEIERLADQGLDDGQIVETLFGRESSLRELTDGHMSYRYFVAAFTRRRAAEKAAEPA